MISDLVDSNGIKSNGTKVWGIWLIQRGLKYKGFGQVKWDSNNTRHSREGATSRGRCYKTDTPEKVQTVSYG